MAEPGIFLRNSVSYATNQVAAYHMHQWYAGLSSLRIVQGLQAQEALSKWCKWKLI